MLLYIITLLIYTIMLNILIIIKQAIYQIILSFCFVKIVVSRCKWW